MKLLAILLLALPLVFHLWNDRNGDTPEEKPWDILVVAAIAYAAAFAGYKLAGKPIIDGLLLAWGLHFMIFDYAIVAILKRRGVIETKQHWFEYLGSSYTDDVLRQFTPWQRFYLKLSVLVIATLIYVYEIYRPEGNPNALLD